MPFFPLCIEAAKLQNWFQKDLKKTQKKPWELWFPPSPSTACHLNTSLTHPSRCCLILLHVLPPSLSVRCQGIIKHGGEKPNIIPAYTEVDFFLRTPLLRDLRVLKAKAEACFKAAALATGCQVKTHLEIFFLKIRYPLRQRARHTPSCRLHTHCVTITLSKKNTQSDHAVSAEPPCYIIQSRLQATCLLHLDLLWARWPSRWHAGVHEAPHTINI